LMELQQKIAFEYGDSLIGYELDVLIDAQIDDETWVGRSFADAPEIDGAIYVNGTELEVGELAAVEITGRQDYDLIGSLLAAEESVPARRQSG